MNEQNQRDSIMSMARGAFEERVDYEMDKVIQNILDPNTKATAKRKITITLTFAPDDYRQQIGMDAQAKTTLAPIQPVRTSLCAEMRKLQETQDELSIFTSLVAARRCRAGRCRAGRLRCGAGAGQLAQQADPAGGALPARRQLRHHCPLHRPADFAGTEADRGD